VAEDALDDFLKVLNEAKTNKTDFECEYGIKTKNGKHKIVHTKSKAILDEHGNLKRIIGITRDITDVKNFEKERDRSIRELNRSNKELEEFAYIASHDLQEPLRKISTFGERLKLKIGPTLGDEGAMYLDRILASTENMRILIDNLLEFSKISSSNHLYSPCDLNEILNTVLSDQEIGMEETKIVLNIDKLPRIEGAPSELKQLFNNLLSNAIKFRRPDVQLKVAIRSEKLARSAKEKYHLPADRTYFRIDIIDNGIGFEKEYAERIFQIFQRLHGKAEYPGSGIGLAICKKIVDNHEGLIHANGTLNRGSIFTIVLPQKQSI
jgi:light-regulated signal transduction histidine kinase (bacteriophytochrome)